jgi:hypothetical protein
MDKNRQAGAADPTEDERRKNLSDSELRELELAGGVEGGMQAGSAGGPSGSGRKKGSSPAAAGERQDSRPPRR